MIILITCLITLIMFNHENDDVHNITNGCHNPTIASSTNSINTTDGNYSMTILDEVQAAPGRGAGRQEPIIILLIMIIITIITIITIIRSISIIIISIRVSISVSISIRVSISISISIGISISISSISTISSIIEPEERVVAEHGPDVAPDAAAVHGASKSSPPYVHV